MPCFSRIEQTKMTNADRLMTALLELQIKAVKKNDNLIQAGGMTFSRRNSNEGFGAQGETTRLSEIGRKYAELSIRAYAQRKGLSIVSNDGKRIEMVNRRVY